ncbi:MAG: hypothetical protein HXY38_11365 [Chloroflexi bacterium]|nr:hypothetical protein [Chloroflexota bacterium]
MKNSPFIKYGSSLLFFLLVTAFAFFLREKAASNLNRDSDEATYLAAGEEFAALIQTGNWSGFLETNPNPEHPPFTKILFGFAIVNQPQTPADMPVDDTVFSPRGASARQVSVIFGALAAGLLALVNPFAGLLLAMHTMTIKYTSEIMLEAVAAFTSLASVLCYIGCKKNLDIGWWVASALLLGLTAANKYIYAVVGFAILLDWLIDTFETNKQWSRFFKTALLWGLTSLAAFILFNPYLWTDPIERLSDSLFFHSNYSQNAPEVVELAFPTHQPFIWLTTSAKDWHPQNIFIYSVDNFFLIMSVLGLALLWRKERVYVFWILFGMAFLLVWPTKWPQYTIILSAPLALSAGEAVRVIFKTILKK